MNDLARALVDRVEYGRRELTIDAAELTPQQVSAIREYAESRGLDVSGTSRWILVRRLTPVA